MSLPTVALHVLGGTITMTAGAKGIRPQLTGADLLQQVPALGQIAQLDVHTPVLKPGPSLTMAEIASLAKAIQAQNNVAGHVVVQGTDTIDETAFLLHLLYDGPAPLVVTGAMRGASALSADGPANLYTAVTAAASPKLQHQGVLVALNDEIHSGIYAEKMHKGLCNAFQSPNGGPLAYVFEQSVQIIRQLPKRPALNLKPQKFGRVAIIKVSLDDRPDLLAALDNLGYEGVVIEVMGAVHKLKTWVEAIAKLAQKMPVVLSSRVLAGPIFRQTYGFEGSEISLLDKGLIAGGWLSPPKARLLLAAAIGCGLNKTETSRLFDQY